MEFYPFSVLASGNGSSIEIPAQGNYVRFYDISAGSSAPKIRIVARGPNGSKRALLKNGEGVRFREAFQRLTLSNEDASNTITGIIQIGDEDEFIESDRLQGEVNVSDNAARLLGLVYQGTSPWATSDYGTSFSSSFSSNTAGTGGAVENIVAAATNTAGLRIVDAQMWCRASAGGEIRGTLLCKATAPASEIDGQIILLAGHGKVTSTTPVATAEGYLRKAIRVASGKRLDRFPVTTEDGLILSVLYDVL